MIDRKAEKQDYLERKRIEVLAVLKPKCNAFGIDDYDYIVNDGIERLRIGNTYIGCSSNSISAVVDEFIGYLFIKRWCRNRCLGAFSTQSKNVIKRYWTEVRNE